MERNGTMALPVLIEHLVRTKLGAYCARKVPAEARAEVRLDFEVAGDHVTLVESRPYFRDPRVWTRLPVARFRFNATSGTWTLYCPSFGQKNTWRPYPAQPSRDLDRLIAALDADASGAFWG
jgi:hypothetical protein